MPMVIHGKETLHRCVELMLRQLIHSLAMVAMAAAAAAAAAAMVLVLLFGGG